MVRFEFTCTVIAGACVFALAYNLFAGCERGFAAGVAIRVVLASTGLGAAFLRAAIVVGAFTKIGFTFFMRITIFRIGQMTCAQAVAGQSSTVVDRVGQIVVQRPITIALLITNKFTTRTGTGSAYFVVTVVVGAFAIFVQAIIVVVACAAVGDLAGTHFLSHTIAGVGCVAMGGLHTLIDAITYFVASIKPAACVTILSVVDTKALRTFSIGAFTGSA